MEKLLRLINEYFRLVILIILISYLLIYYQNAQNGRYVKLGEGGLNIYIIMDTRTGETYYLDSKKTPRGKERWSKLMPAVND